MTTDRFNCLPGEWRSPWSTSPRRGIAGGSVFSKLSVVAAILLAGTSGASAQTIRTWNASSPYWHNSASWSPGGLPGTSDTALFSSNIVDTIVWDATTGNRQTGKLSVTAGNYLFDNSSASANQYTLQINNTSSSLSVTGASTALTARGLHIDIASGYGWIGSGSTFNLDGADPSGALLTSGQFYNSGTVNLTSGAIANLSSQNFVGYGGSASTLNVLGGSQWNGSSVFYVGRYSNGTLNVQSGGLATNTNGYLGSTLSSYTTTGTATVSGSGSKWINTGDLTVGSNGTGALSINSNGAVLVGNSDPGYGGTYINVGDSSSSGGGANLYVNAGSSIANTGFASIGGAASTYGTATVDGSGADWANTSLLYVGTYGTGVLNVQGGGTVSNNIGYIGWASGSSGAATVTGSGSKWANSANLYVGNSGNGTLDVDSAGEVQVGNTDSGYSGTHLDISDSVQSTSRGNLFVNGGSSITNAGFAAIGGAASSYGTATVSGTGAQWNNGGNAYVGYSGTGSLNVQSGGIVSNQNGYLGFSSGSTGAATVTGLGSQWNSSNHAYVGYSGAGTLDIQSGGVVSNQNGYLGLGSGSTGTATVNGLGSQWNNSGQMFVGSSGRGTLGIYNGGVVTNQSAYIGNGSDTNTVIVQGSSSATSEWNNTGSLLLGYGGSGTNRLYVYSKGVVSSTSGYVGYQSSGTTNAIVNGAGAQWNNSGSLFVGSYGSGTNILNVQNGGVVSNADGYVGGYYSTTSGTVNVVGSGAEWNNSNDLNVGYNGTGQVNINSSGLVTVGGTTTINAASAVTLNGGRFEFGTTTLDDLSRVGGTSGALAGDIGFSGYNSLSSLTALQATTLDISEVNARNNGVLYGSGAIDSAIKNTSSGELRTLQGEWARIGGVGSTNAGEINNLGGAVEFEQELTNESTGFVSGRGLFVASGGYTNDGVFAMSGGFSDIHGDVANGAAGVIAIGGGSTTTFYDDVVMNAAKMNIDVSENSNAVFFGSYNGGNDGLGTVHAFGDLRPGNSPDVVSFGGDLELGNNTQTFIELAGLNYGQYDQLVVAGDLSLNGFLDVALIDGFTLGLHQQFLVADVDGMLLGEFSNLGEGDLVGHYGGMDLFITYSGGDGNDISLMTAVAEPGQLGLLCLGTAVVLIRRRRAISNLGILAQQTLSRVGFRA